MSGEKKVTYAKVLGNPGFLKCLEPECAHDPSSVQAAQVYAHAWDKHRTNYIHIKAPDSKDSTTQ